LLYLESKDKAGQRLEREKREEKAVHMEIR
jgi:hypothetical protein